MGRPTKRHGRPCCPSLPAVCTILILHLRTLSFIPSTTTQQWSSATRTRPLSPVGTPFFSLSLTLAAATQNTPVATTDAAAARTGGGSNTTAPADRAATPRPSVQQIRAASFTPELLLGCQKAATVVNQLFTSANLDEVGMFRGGEINTLSADTAFKINSAAIKGHEVYAAAMQRNHPGDTVIGRLDFRREYSRYIKVYEDYVR